MLDKKESNPSAALVKDAKLLRGRYKSGLETQQKILDAAVNLLIEKGYHNFSFRKVAQSSGVSVGNLQHYYPIKNDLVKAMLDRVIQDYIDNFNQLLASGITPEQQLHGLLEQVIRDLSNKQTTVFFPELWSLANHDKEVDMAMQRMYARYREILVIVVLRINPSLSTEQARKAALFISCSIEGHTVFIGYQKPWTDLTEDVIKMAFTTFLMLIKTGSIPK